MRNRSFHSPAWLRLGRSPSLALAVAVTIAAPACKPTLPIPIVKGPDGKQIDPPPPPKAEDETAASALEADAKKLIDDGDASGAAKKLELLLDTYPGTAAGARQLKTRGDGAEADGDVQLAISYFEKLLFYRPSFIGADNIRERYAGLLLRVDRFEDAANMLRALHASAKAPPDRARLGMTLADTLSALQRDREALELYVDVHSVAGADNQKRTADRAYDITAGGLSFKEAEDLWDDVEGKSSWNFILPALAFKLAKIYYHTRDYGRSKDMARLVTGRWASSDFGSQARDLLVRLNNREKVEPRRIGVLLPLSGRYQQYGSRSLDAIKLAFGKDSKIELVIKDSEGNARVAAKDVEDLVFENHVIAIIGPLFSGEALGAALKAEELSVPFIALSHREGLPEIGDWVFRTALTVKAQAQALAKTAFDDLGMTRYALLYPRSRYGKTFANAFWDEVERRGGEIRGVESYEHNQTTFQEPVRKLVGRYYDMSRQDYKDGKRDCRRKRLPSHLEKRCIKDLKKGLEPIVDFDAIVIPDSGRNLGLIAPALAFEDIITERNPKKLETIRKASGHKNLQPVTLLGGSTWNSIQTLQNCEHYCNNAVFVDAYYPDSTDPKVRDFVSAFRDATGAEPNLSEAQAFDTASMVKWLLTANAPKDRVAFRRSLLTMTGYVGSTGKMSFDKTGEVQKELQILTITGGSKDRSIRLWEPDAKRPRG